MKIAINGFGRIGRLVFRIMEEDDFFDMSSHIPVVYIIEKLANYLRKAKSNNS